MKKYIILIIIALATTQVGCRTDIDKEIVETKEPNTSSIQVSSEDKEIIDRSENLSDFVVELFGVDDAATIIFNDTALVTVVMAYDKELTEDTKELINDLVMEKDAGINQVLISQDEKTFFEVIEVISELMNGSPYDNHVDQISKMIEKSNKKN
ncbi:YhcN/YlaJ family sporulation lipoprotein [Tissierella sp.]|uniref:YhcN/YlaJ family sporulation lipoprotein n=1 Tax=Tissierella sp. TaxID=41274 RepID=UPI00285F3F62|nr:YhcN/YlaJ family sporulation lipoprotein [Tissierella sp.]MDR7857175.1 YhcN/YlaJ family sporulation lipoprotein [Tissierella sp.]